MPVDGRLCRGVACHMEQLETLRVFPAAAARVLQVARSCDAGLSDMVDAVSLDPVLAGRVLKLVNAPLYGMRTRVSSLDRAIAALGFLGTRDVALALAIGGIGADRTPWGRQVWRHALATGWAARGLARHVRQVDAEAAFVTGLLHDVGVQLLMVLHGDAFDTFAEEAGGLDAPRLDEERALFGVDHAQLGAAALRRWSLPGNVVDAVARHHGDRSPTGHARPRDVAVLQIADVLTQAVGRGEDAEAAAAVALMHPAADVLRAVRGAYVAAAEQLVAHWGDLDAF